MSVFKWRLAFQSSLVQPFREKANVPHNKGTTAQRQQPALQLVQFLSGRRKRSCTLWGHTKTSGVKACSLRFDFRSCHPHYSALIPCLFSRWLFYQKALIRRYYLALQKHTAQLVRHFWDHQGGWLFFFSFLFFFKLVVNIKKPARKCFQPTHVSLISKLVIPDLFVTVHLLERTLLLSIFVRDRCFHTY